MIIMVKISNVRLSKKYIRTPSGKVSLRFERKSSSISKCGLTGKALQGTPKGKDSKVKKLSKTEKRPSVVFGGVLSNKARDQVFEEAIKVKIGYKKLEDVSISMKKYVTQALHSITV